VCKASSMLSHPDRLAGPAAGESMLPAAGGSALPAPGLRRIGIACLTSLLHQYQALSRPAAVPTHRYRRPAGGRCFPSCPFQIVSMLRPVLSFADLLGCPTN